MIIMIFAVWAYTHYLASQPRTSLGSLAVGILPNVVLMLATGTLTGLTLGMAILFAGYVTARQVIEQYRRTIEMLIQKQEILSIANTDILTGLPNRRAYLEAFARALAQERNGYSFGVAILDLDGFKPINDRLGHIAGDGLLRIVGQRLRDHLPNGDCVGRLGGDEFAFLFHNVVSEAEISQRASGVLAALCLPAKVGEEMIPISASLGYSSYPHDGATLSELLAAADSALYAAKHNGKAQIKRGIVAVVEPDGAAIVKRAA